MSRIIKISRFLIVLISLSFVSFIFSKDGKSGYQLKPGDIKIRKINIEVYDTPRFVTNNIKRKQIKNPKKWVEIESEFKIKLRKDIIISDLLFKYYVGIKTREKRGRILSGKVVYKNIPSQEHQFSSMYISPSVLNSLRSGYDTNFSKALVKASGVEIYYQGVLISWFSSKKNKFWEGSKTVEGIVNKSKTPFNLLWNDNYPEIEDVR